MFTCEIVRSLDRFYELQREWDTLLTQFDGDNLFLSWPWMHRWVECYGRHHPLLVIVLRDRQGPVAIAPFWVQEGSRRVRIRPRVARFLGAGECCPDYLDMLVRQDVRHAAVGGVWEALITNCRQDWDVLEYGDTPCDSDLLPWFARLADGDARCRAVEIIDSVVCPVMPLPDSPEQVLASQTGTHRYSVSRSRRRLHELGALRVTWSATAADVEVSMGLLRDLNRRVWEARGETGSFASTDFEHFHAHLARDLLDQNRLLLAHASFNDRYIGGFYGMQYRGRLYFYIMSVERSEHRHVNMGDVMLLEAMEEGVRRGCTEFDFLRGDEEYKYRWTQRERRHLQLRVYNRSAHGRGLFLARGVKRRCVGQVRTLGSYAPQVTPSTDRPAAIVLGSGVTALGVIRGLGLAGVRVLQVAQQAGAERRSRFCAASVDLPQSPTSVESGQAALEACFKLHGLDRAVVIPCSDEANDWVARLPLERRHQFLTSLPPAETLTALMDKGHLARLLDEHGVPHPATWPLKATSDLENLDPALFGHAFLKPCQSQSFFTRYHVKAVSVRSREEAITRWKQLSGDGHDMVLQDYIPGAASNHYFVDGMVDRFGDLKCVFARRRLRMHPPDYGNSSYQVSTAQGSLNRSISALRGLLKATSYRGLFSAEFKLDERDGAYRLLEINCRPWWFIWFTQLCGLPMAEMAYADALDEPLPTLRFYLEGVPMVYPYYDFNSCMTRIREGKMSYTEWVSSWLLARQAVVTWRDPLPSLINLAGGLGRYLKGTVGPHAPSSS